MNISDRKGKWPTKFTFPKILTKREKDIIERGDEIVMGIEITSAIFMDEISGHDASLLGTAKSTREIMENC
ncbi:hypothetical protein B4O97_09355 [Marispirochaeta aestuarii]|uniref:Uncharacterized protein n=1 Tax=Marispirochaeta aestuarii TaxID=1963862 RepID=A0A1Y1RY35_9SPIO|nr:hypothetical protein [Marispirochaeta aestuarii]ORC35371.1 hypothetical protein B4O97_09355 [Marispirochaeta aestuarii]